MFRFVLVLALAALARSSYIPSKEPTDEGIVGGVDTRIEEHPYQLALLLNNRFICGASLIKPNAALTAAHCTRGRLPSRLKIRAGSTYTANGGTLANVRNICDHKKFDYDSGDYDLSVLLLDRPLPLSASIKTIPLQPAGAELPDGTIATITGWGKLRHQGPSPLILQKVEVPKVSQEKCANAYNSIRKVTERMTCYGYTEGGKGPCQGDSGGPIIVNGKQIGVVSWGLKCAKPGYPGVFAKVSNKEIADHIQKCTASF